MNAEESKKEFKEAVFKSEFHVFVPRNILNKENTLRKYLNKELKKQADWFVKTSVQDLIEDNAQ